MRFVNKSLSLPQPEHACDAQEVRRVVGGLADDVSSHRACRSRVSPAAEIPPGSVYPTSAPNGIPTMSAATGLMHVIGQRDGVWGLETIDFETGASVSIIPSAQTLCSQAVLDAVSASALGPLIDPIIDPVTGTYPATCENSVFAATEVGLDGAVYTGTFQGASRFTPNVVARRSHGGATRPSA